MVAIRLPDGQPINVDLASGEIYIEGMDVEYIDLQEYFVGE
ncbi:hypothetical protein [Natronosalvus amylolyticus]|nr:hypothetical protein [Natronosalvus amylolyticus]